MEKIVALYVLRQLRLSLAQAALDHASTALGIPRDVSLHHVHQWKEGCVVIKTKQEGTLYCCQSKLLFSTKTCPERLELCCLGKVIFIESYQKIFLQIYFLPCTVQYLL